MASHSCIGVVALLAVLFARELVMIMGGARAAALVEHELDQVHDVDSMLTLKMDFQEMNIVRRKLAVSATVWCVAKSNLSDAALQGALDWVCGPMPDQGQVNCGPLQSGGACFTPDTLTSHTSWAFNAYFQLRNASDSACDFQGTATQVTTDPSSSNLCVYPGTVKEVNGAVVTNGTFTTPSAPGIFGPHSGAESDELRHAFYLFIVSAAAVTFSAAYLLPT